MKILHLVLKSVWYDKIASGEKTSEYRECTPYWNKRLCGRDKIEKVLTNFYSQYIVYDTIIFHRGYSNETMEFEIKDIQITNGPNDLQLPKAWEIKLGRRIR